MQGDGVFAVFWRYVEECDLGPAGLGVVGVLVYLVLFVFIWIYLGFCLYLFGLLVCLSGFLFGLWINCAIGILAFAPVRGGTYFLCRRKER